MIASLATYPHEVLRTRLQIKKTSTSTRPLALPSSLPPPLFSPLVTGSSPPLPLPEPEQVPRIGGPPPSRLKPRKGGVVDTFLKIKRQDGWRGFYRGLSINLIRTVPNSAVTMLT